MLFNLTIHRNQKYRNSRLFMLLLGIGFVFFWTSFRPKQTALLRPITTVTPPALPNTTTGELSLLTYNIAGLPGFISSAKTPRAMSISHIGNKINSFDIVNVQEDFNYNASLYSGNKHLFRTEHKGVVPFGDGLSTLSKFPITDFRRITWDDCHGSDCLTPKGFSYARIAIAEGVTVDIYNVHATAENGLQSVKARCKNFKQLANYVSIHSPCQPLIIMGDFNAHYSFAQDSVMAFCHDNALIDSWVLLNNGGMFPKIHENFQAHAKLLINNSVESIDKIYYRNSDHLLFTPVVQQIEDSLFTNKAGQHLSDHLAVSLKLGWKLL